MIQAVVLQYRPDLEMVECLFSVEPHLVERLNKALFEDTNRSFALWNGEPGIWACGHIRVNHEEYEISASQETGEIKVGFPPTRDPLDYFGSEIDLNSEWINFVQPLKHLQELLS